MAVSGALIAVLLLLGLLVSSRLDAFDVCTYIQSLPLNAHSCCNTIIPVFYARFSCVVREYLVYDLCMVVHDFLR